MQGPAILWSQKNLTPVTLCQGGVLTILPIIAHHQGFDAQEGLTITLKNMKDGKLACNKHCFTS
jgi:hypothetical protein